MIPMTPDFATLLQDINNQLKHIKWCVFWIGVMLGVMLVVLLWHLWR